MARSSDGVLLCISVVVCILALAAYPKLSDPSNKIQPRNRIPVQDCTTSMASDLYGLGVRLGVYFQWLSAWIGNTFVPDLTADGLDANAMYLAAILMSIVHSSMSSQMTLMDGLVQMWLCAGTAGSVLSLWGYRTALYRAEGMNAISHFGGFGTHFRLLLTASTAAFAIWYWVHTGRTDDGALLAFGVPGTGQDNINENCVKTTVTVFGLDVQGNARYFGLTLSIIAGSYCSLLLLASPLALVTRVWKMIRFWKDKEFSSTTRLRFATAATMSELKFMSYALSVFSLVWLLFSAISIELALNENCAYAVLGAQTANDDGKILTPGQLLPMVIGAFSFVKLLYTIFENWRNPNGSTSPSLGRAPSNRRVGAQRGPRRHLNIFKLFSSVDAEERPSYSNYEARLAEKQYGTLYPFQRMRFLMRVLITLVPHISLFWSWPWKESIVVDQDGDSTRELCGETRYSVDSPMTPRKDLSVAWSKEVDVQLQERQHYDSP